MSDTTPETHRACKVCGETKPVFFFKMSRRIRNTKKLCWTCLDCRETARATQDFTCTRCEESRPGLDFHQGHGTAISQPCRTCRETFLPAQRAAKRAESGREPMHKILAMTIDKKAETGICTICGPTQLRRVVQSKTGNVNWRCFTYAAKYEMEKRPKQKGFVEKKERHFLTNRSEDDKRADCSVCGPDVAIYFYARDGYGRCMNAQRNHLYSRYGITAKHYREMYAEQNGECAICHEPHEVLCVDHDHVSGNVRFLLCRGCNVGIGGMKDDPILLRRAAELIEFARQGDPFYADQNGDARQGD